MCTQEGAVFCDWELQDLGEDLDTSGSTVGALMDFLEEEEMPSGSVGHPKIIERPHLSSCEAAAAREENDSTTDKSDLEELICEPLTVKIKRPRVECICSLCGSDFKSGHELDKHTQAQHVGQRPFACDKCDASFETGHLLMVHISSCHSNRVYSCTCCLATAPLRYKMKLHVRVHLSKKAEV